jgi:hypothetical protein
MLMSHHQNAEQKHHIKTVTKISENVADLEYLAMRVTDYNYIHEEIKCRINL